MEAIIKSQAINGHLRGKTEKDGVNVYTFIASTSDPDRHRTVLNQDNWELDNYRANPIIGYQHNLYGDMCNAPDPDDVIGKSVKTYIEKNQDTGEKQLLIDVIFDQENEKAQKIESKVDRGFLSTVSVGFGEVGDGHRGNDDDGEDKELYYFHGQELYEVSIVNIPSNPKAKKKSLRAQTFDALQYIYRELGGKHRLSEIETMTVREILDLLNGEEPKKVEKNRSVNILHEGKLIKTKEY